MTELKERKYYQCMKSECDGFCNHCKGTKNRSWKKGHKVYVHKKEDGKWAACTDKKCFLEQGGILTYGNHINYTPIEMYKFNVGEGVEEIKPEPIPEQTKKKTNNTTTVLLINWTDEEISQLDDINVKWMIKRERELEP